MGKILILRFGKALPLHRGGGKDHPALTGTPREEGNEKHHPVAWRRHPSRGGDENRRVQFPRSGMRNWPDLDLRDEYPSP